MASFNSNNCEKEKSSKRPPNSYFMFRKDYGNIFVKWFPFEQKKESMFRLRKMWKKLIHVKQRYNELGKTALSEFKKNNPDLVVKRQKNTNQTAKIQTKNRLKKHRISSRLEVANCLRHGDDAVKRSFNVKIFDGFSFKYEEIKIPESSDMFDLLAALPELDSQETRNQNEKYTRNLKLDPLPAPIFFTSAGPSIYCSSDFQEDHYAIASQMAPNPVLLEGTDWSGGFVEPVMEVATRTTDSLSFSQSDSLFETDFVPSALYHTCGWYKISSQICIRKIEETSE